MRAFVAVRQALPILATKQDIEDLRQRVKALEEAGIAIQQMQVLEDNEGRKLLK